MTSKNLGVPALRKPFRQLFFMFALAIWASIASAQQYPIAKLTTSGSERFLAEDILRSTGLSEDKTKEVPLATVQSAAEKLVATGAFAEVKYKHIVAPGGMKVEFELVDKDDDQFIDCNFDNIVWLPEAELNEELHKRVPLFNGTVPRDGTLTDDISAALQALLKQRGITTILVASVQEPTNTGSTEAVVFRAVDMDLKIARVNIPGASPALATELDTETKRILGTTYNRGSLKKFAERNLRSVYSKRGYLRAAFSSPAVEVVSTNEGQTEVAVAIPVTEGLPYKFAALRWSGNKALAAEELDKQIHPVAGAVLDGADLAKRVNAVRTRYAAMGYMRMMLAANPAFNDAAGTVSYELVVYEGDLFQMGKFEVEGLQSASAEKVRQTWKLREGDPFDSTYVKKFFTQFHLPADTPYVVEETEGEHPRSIDLTIIFCKPNDPCRPKAESHLFTPQDAELETKP